MQFLDRWSQRLFPGATQGARRFAPRMAWVIALLLLGGVTGTAYAAQVSGGDVYVLPRGEVINDDLYVAGGEVIIDGTVEGDLVVAGAYVEINGVVTGDLVAAGAAVILSGVVQDDVRVAGGGVIVRGAVGDDLVAAASGGWPGQAFFPPIRGRSVPQGLQITSAATVGGDALLAGGQGDFAGSIGQNLWAVFRIFNFGGRVNGDAEIRAESLRVAENARVQGELRVATPAEMVVPAATASTVVREPWMADAGLTVERSLVDRVLSWLWRTLLTLAGMLFLGWLFWSVARPQLKELATVVDERPAVTGIVGVLVAVALLPISVALVFLATLIWGFFPGGLMTLMMFFGFFAVLWLISPAIIGLWVGRKIAAATGAFEGELAHLLVGITAIVLGGRLLTLIPCIGTLAFQVIYMQSFIFLVGGWLLLRGARLAPPAVLRNPS